MKKNIKKLFTFLFILIIIFENYANSGFVDNSAFITKSEFDKRLEEFDTRLTIFEASVNSKIDAQVTTYLDRNGIWSSKDQTLENQGWLDIGAWSEAYSGLNLTGTNAFAGNGYAVHKFTDKKIVNKINKSGLVFVEGFSRCPGSGREARATWYAQGDNTTGQNGYLSTIYAPNFYTSSGGTFSSYGMEYFHRGGPFITAYLYVIHEGASEKIPIAMVRGVADCGKQGLFCNSDSTTTATMTFDYMRQLSGYYYVWYRNAYFNTTGFVTKGDSLYFHIENGYSGGMYGSNYALGFTSNNNGSPSMRAILDVTSARVY